MKMTILRSIVSMRGTIALLIILATSVVASVACDIRPRDPETGLLIPSPTPAVAAASAAPRISPSLDHLIFIADTVVRVKPPSANSDIVETIPSNEGVAPTYRPGQALHFEVIEYLKGDGGSEIIVEVPIDRRTFLKREGATDLHTLYNSVPPHPDDAWHKRYPHNPKWDDREAILLLVRQDPDNRLHGSKESTTADHYHFASQGTYGEDNNPTGYPYAVESWNKAWLPASEVSQSGEESLTFLADPNPIRNVTELTEISLDDVHARIESVDNRLAAGSEVEGYAECLGKTYGDDGWMRQYQEVNGKPYVPGTGDNQVQAGSPAETVLDEWTASGRGFIRHWLVGPGAEYFEFVVHHGDENEVIKAEDIDYEATRTQFIGYTMQLRTTRPLPARVYALDEYAQAPWFIACDYMPDVPPAKLIVTVVSSTPSIHEALFDPADVDDETVGFSTDNGVLDSDALTVNGTGTTIGRLDWSSSKVQMQLTPHNLLPGQHIDFIALDGSVSLRLDFDDAVEVSEDDGTQALSWGVCEQPWQDGDKLMIRISESGADLTGATNDAECAATPVVEQSQSPVAAETPEPSAEVASESAAATAPQNLSATPTHDSVTLTWDGQSLSSIVRYDILRKTQSNDTTDAVGEADSDESGYTDSDGIQPETEYTYTVKTVTDGKELASTVTVTTLAAP